METKSQYLRYFMVLLVIGILFGIGWMLGKNGVRFFNELPLTGTDNSIPADADKYYLLGPELEVKEGWQPNGDMQGYYEPTLEELDSIYKAARKAKDQRSLDDFLNVSTERVAFIMLNTFRYKGVNRDQNPIVAIIPPSGIEFYNSYAPMKTDFCYPTDLNQYTPLSISKFDFQPDPDTIIDDQVNNKYYMLVDKDFENYYALDYSIKDLTGNNLQKTNDYTYEGRVYFAWDHGKWRYNTEDWYILSVAGTSSGDTALEARNTVTVKRTDNEGLIGYDPKVITINAGDKVIWEIVSGVMGSTGSTNGLAPWHSSRLINQSFEKLFTEKGSYNYSILMGENEFRGQIIIN